MGHIQHGLIMEYAVESEFQNEVKRHFAFNFRYGFQGDRIFNSSVKWLKFNR